MVSHAHTLSGDLCSCLYVVQVKSDALSSLNDLVKLWNRGGGPETAHAKGQLMYNAGSQEGLLK